MSTGTQLPAEWKTITDPQTGCTLRQFTSAAANSYPLYYFIDTITPDSKTLIFHNERSGWVQLYKMDLETGEMAQLTDGRTRDSGWAIWSERLFARRSPLRLYPRRTRPICRSPGRS